MSKIKICGLFREEDIRYVNEAMPDFIGFVFAKSRRQVSFERARTLRAALHPNIVPVGVFVNEAMTNVVSLVTEKIIDWVQLHGTEDAAYIAALRQKIPCPIIKSVGVVQNAQSPLLPEPSFLGADYCLFDTQKNPADNTPYGGTGEAFDWSVLVGYQSPYFLAGGITEHNIERALSQIKPWCLDVSSGAETNGMKDEQKIRRLVRLAHARLPLGDALMKLGQKLDLSEEEADALKQSASKK